MNSNRRAITISAAAVVTALLAAGRIDLTARQATRAVPLGTSASLEGLLSSTLVFFAADGDKDGVVTREELKAAGGRWFTAADVDKAGAVTERPADIGAQHGNARVGAGRGIQHGRARRAAADGAAGNGRRDDGGAPRQCARAPAASAQSPGRGARRRLRALVDSSRRKDDRGDGDEDRCMVDDDLLRRGRHYVREPQAIRRGVPGQHRPGRSWTIPANASLTAARRQALLDFVRGGKGLAGIHAATDSYHQDTAPPPAGGGPASMMASFSAGSTLAPVMMKQGDRNGDQKLDRAEVDASPTPGSRRWTTRRGDG